MNGEEPEMIPMERVRHFAHEAAAPLMVVTMISEMLLEDRALSPSQADDVRKIQHAAGELAQLIRVLRTG